MEYYKAYDRRYKQIHDMGLSWTDDIVTNKVIEVINKYNINKNTPLLEIGCGEGRDARYLLSKGYNLLATDVSQEAINYCINKDIDNKNNYIVLDVLNNNYNKKFKFIYSVACLHMFVLDEDRNKYYKFIYNHLDKGGISLILTMGNGKDEYQSNIKEAYTDVSRTHQSTGTEIKIASTSCRMVNFDTLNSELNNNNFKIIESGITSIDNHFNEMMYVVIKTEKE